jgi:hypothetical protein
MAGRESVRLVCLQSCDQHCWLHVQQQGACPDCVVWARPLNWEGHMDSSTWFCGNLGILLPQEPFVRNQLAI